MIYKLPEGPRSPPVSFPNPLREIHDCNEEQFQSKNFLHCIRQNKPLSAMVIWENLISPQSGSNLVLLTLSCPDLCSVPQVHRSRSRRNIGTHQKIKVKVIKQTRHEICQMREIPPKWHSVAWKRNQGISWSSKFVWSYLALADFRLKGRWRYS